MSALDGQVSRLEARASLVEKIEARLNGLNTLSTEIDQTGSSSSLSVGAILTYSKPHPMALAHRSSTRNTNSKP